MPKIKISFAVLRYLRDEIQTLARPNSRQTIVATVTGCQHKTLPAQDVGTTTVILDKVSRGDAADTEASSGRLQITAKYTEPSLAENPLLCGTVEDYTTLIRTLQNTCRSSKFCYECYDYST